MFVGGLLDKYEVYRSAYCIESVKANQPGGIQDQLFASLGGAWRTELGESDTPQLEMMDLHLVRVLMISLMW